MGIKHFLRELLPHAAWDAIRHILIPAILAIVLPALYQLVGRIGHLPTSTIITFCLFIITLLISIGTLIYVTRKDKKQYDPINIGLTRAYPERATSEQKLTFPLKVRCEFQNLSDKAIKVRASRWIPGNGGVNADFRANTLQLPGIH